MVVNLALSPLLHAAYFQSTVSEETGLELSCHKDVRMAVLVASAKEEKPGRERAEGSLSPDVFLVPSLLSLGHATGQECLQANVDQRVNSNYQLISLLPFFFFLTHFTYFWPPRHYLTMTSTISLCVSFFESSRVCSLEE